MTTEGVNNWELREWETAWGKMEKEGSGSRHYEMARSRLRGSEKASADTEEKGIRARSTEPGEPGKGLTPKGPIDVYISSGWWEIGGLD